MVKKFALPLAGIITGLVSLALVQLGNPANMGFCIACFLRDTAGAVGLHSAANVQYVRPEVIGIILGAFIFSLVKREFSPKGGSAPVTRFTLGFALMIGALIFLGCPLRMMLRLAGGDMSALAGLAGFAAGIFCGVFFLNKGYSLKRTYEIAKTDGLIPPGVALAMLALVVIAPSFLLFSTAGPGSMRAPIWAALAAGLIMGGVGFISRLCFVAGIRDSVLFKSFAMFGAFVALIATVFVGNLVLGNFTLGFVDQPVAHNEWLWNFLGMSLVGICAVLLGGCPFKQVVLAGSGNSDSAITLLGMIAGSAFAHNFSLASSPAGVTTNGKIGLGVAFAVVACIAVCNTFRKKGLAA